MGLLRFIIGQVQRDSAIVARVGRVDLELPPAIEKRSRRADQRAALRIVFGEGRSG